MSKVYELHAHDPFLVSPSELAHAEQKLRALHKQDATATIEEHLLMVRALAAIANGHANPRALAEVVISTIDRAASGT
jgi:hypothetical protein